MNYNIISSETRYYTNEKSIRDASRRIKLKQQSLKNVSKFYKKEDSMDFKIGDRVTHHDKGTGTVIGFSANSVGVEYDEFCYGHSCFSVEQGNPGKSGHCWWEPKDNIIKIEEKQMGEGEKNMINYNSIISIYKERKLKEYQEERNTQKENIEDEYTKLNKEFNEKLLKQLKKDNMESEFDCFKRTTVIYTEKRHLEEKRIDEEYYEKERKTNKLVREVEAQLGLCTTREETLEILKLYKIVDENGKIYGCEE